MGKKSKGFLKLRTGTIPGLVAESLKTGKSVWSAIAVPDLLEKSAKVSGIFTQCKCCLILQGGSERNNPGVKGVLGNGTTIAENLSRGNRTMFNACHD